MGAVSNNLNLSTFENNKNMFTFLSDNKHFLHINRVFQEGNFSRVNSQLSQEFYLKKSAL